MIFIEVLLIIAKTGKKPKCLSLDKMVNCGTSRKWNIIQHYEEMSYQAMKKYEETLNVHYLVKKAKLKRLSSVGFQQYDIIEMSKV